MEDLPKIQAYLTERQKNRAIVDTLKETPIGMALLIKEREEALFYAKKRDDFDQDIFDRGYPPYKFSKKGKRLRVRVSYDALRHQK